MPPDPAPVLDEPMLLARVGGNRALARGLLREFYVSHADVVHRIRAALGAEALDDAFRLLHRTAGTAANLGLGPLAAAAGQAEEVVRAATRKAGDLHALNLQALDLDTVERRLHQAMAAIQQTGERLADSAAVAPGGEGGGGGGGGHAADRSRRAMLLARLCEQLQTSDLQALDTASDLAPLLGPEAAALAAAVARLDFAEAAGILSSLTIPEGETRCQSRPPQARC